MPYTLTEAAIQRVEPALTLLLAAQTDVELPCDEPAKLAYQLHNALAAIEHFPDYQRFAGLAARFKIRVRPKKVVCELRGATIVQTTVRFPDLDSVSGIVGTLVQTKPQEAYFPNAILAQEELEQLWKWCEVNEYKVVNHEEAGVTVTKNETPLAWRPNAQA